MYEITNDNQIRDKSQLKSLSKSVYFMTKKSSKYERERQEKDNVMYGQKSDMVVNQQKD